MKHIHLQEVDSTNSYLKKLISAHPDLDNLTVITAWEQTSGRGQRGNSWESAAGEDITLSLMIRPTLSPSWHPFDLNVVTSLALHHTVSSLLSSEAKVAIKWPNDLLVNDHKIAGILTENEWEGGKWSHSIVGIGLNVRQETFGIYTPPATSIQLEQKRSGMPTTFRTDDYEEWHHPLVKEIVKNISTLLSLPSPMELRASYHQYLYRKDILATYALPTGEQFRGTLLQVLPNGLLEIQDEGKTLRHFAFKEVQFVHE